jgi:hypothetical protein
LEQRKIGTKDNWNKRQQEQKTTETKDNWTKRQLDQKTTGPKNNWNKTKLKQNTTLTVPKDHWTHHIYGLSCKVWALGTYS